MSTVEAPAQTQMFFTPTQAAAFLLCSPDTIRKLYDNGTLKGNRDTPRGYRQISRESLIAEMTVRQLDIGDLAPVENQTSGTAPSDGSTGSPAPAEERDSAGAT